MLKKSVASLIAIMMVIIICLSLVACNTRETKENIKQDIQKVKDATEENRPADKLINGILGGKSDNN